MNKNYYEILQINQNASSEIIEKAYKTLAKKYHPDLQEESKKSESEEILKEINEAYEVLSDPIKRKNYDMTLTNSSISEEKLNQLYNENQILKKELHNLQENTKKASFQGNSNTNTQHTIKNNNQYNNIYTPNSQNNTTNNAFFEEELQRARQKAYHDAYIQDLENRGYKIRYKKTFKEQLKNILALCVAITFFFLILQLPFVKSFFYDLTKDNMFLRSLIDLFKK